ncbi:MAG: S-methyl-5'-thioinosine phosphorylase [Gammaproteobacteria bacterium]|nr:S-methyl-5'-thioinosine phosphorylase [Gammaproteobacteria bacterium]MYD77251.1 S-methyl-5'-thioinosine phosphorylase [Gammaproteobacteria bacterium]MYJ52398.1 S-methyl-5'-thioinosine phosphorylase [Gammaproteobacteria bacterium]
MLGIIGGTGLEELPDFELTRRESVDTPFGEPSSVLLHVSIRGTPAVFLSRHGIGTRILPHRINYRANVYALRFAGVTEVIALGAVGGIDPEFSTGALAVPDQIIDYTWGREHTCFDGATILDLEMDHLGHANFTSPYDSALRNRILASARDAEIPLIDHGVYGVTQGPRLETAAEIDRMERDGVDIVGMTAMPEAALARELEIDYATVAMVVNPAAGRSDTPISMKSISRVLEGTTWKAMRLLSAYCSGS